MAPGEDDDVIVELEKTPGGKLKRSLASMIITASRKELEDRKRVLKNANLFLDFGNVLKCTKCSSDYTSLIKEGRDLQLHPILHVMFCSVCSKFYGDGDFSVDEDEEDKYCRWCGEGGTLFLCSQCICGFCPKCIKKNLGTEALRKVKDDDNWSCLICRPKPLWRLRHITHLATQQAKTIRKQIREARESRLLRLKKKVVDHAQAGKKPPRKRIVTKSSSDESCQIDPSSVEVAKKPVKTKISESSSIESSVEEEVIQKQDPINDEKILKSPEARPGEVTPLKAPKPSLPESQPDEETPVKISPLLLTPMKGEVKKVVKVLKRLRLMSEFGLKSTERLMRHVTNVSDAKSLQKLSASLDQVVCVMSKMASGVRGKSDSSPTKECEHQVQSLEERMEASAGTSREGDEEDISIELVKPGNDIRIVDEFVNLDQEAEISVVSEKLGNDVVIVDAPHSKYNKNIPAKHKQVLVNGENSDDNENEEIDKKCEGRAKSGKVSDKDKEISPKNGRGKESKALVNGDVNGDDGRSTDSDSSQPRNEKISDPLTPEPRSDAEASEKNDEVAGQDRGEDVQPESEAETTAENTEVDDVTGDNNDSDKMSAEDDEEDCAKKEGDGTDFSAKIKVESAHDADAECGAEKPPTTVSDSDPEPVKPEDTIKSKVLASSSDDSINDSPSKCPSSDSSFGTTKKRKSRRRRNEKSKLAKDSEKREKKQKKKTAKNEIESLTNVKSLRRRRRRKSDSGSDDDEVKPFKSTPKRKQKVKKEKEDTLMDMLAELSDTSGDDDNESENKKPDSFKSYWVNQQNLLKNLVLGTSSSDEDIDEKKVSEDDEVVTKKEIVVKAEADESASDKGKRKRELSIGSSGSDVTKRKDKKKKVVSDSDSDQSSVLEDRDASIKLEGSDSEKKSVKRERSSSGSGSDVKKEKSWKRIAKDSGSDSDSDVAIVSQTTNSPAKGRRNIKQLMKKDALHMETRAAVRSEVERKQRIAKRQALYDKLFPGQTKKLILDFDDKGEILVEVAPRLVKKLKPHQLQGIKFMWDNCFESLQAMETSNGGGCILAHCMGLGKTLQVVALLHTVLTRDVGVDTALIVCPLNTVSNWVHELDMWMRVARCDTIDVYDVNRYKKLHERRHQLKTWHENGGVMIISYDMYRNLTKTPKGVLETTLIRPGPDLVVCDEGHLLKNEDSVLSKCMKKIQTARRIVLTGTPLQNNLKEYHCMVQFIKPNVLGTKNEFMNRFVNPIENGQFEDSTPRDVEIMKRRSHVLHTMLDGCIQRRDYSVLTPFLPVKQEYVISVALAPPLATLYRHYIENQSGKAAGSRATASLFQDFQSLQRIWTHPVCMQAQFERALDKKAREEENRLTDEEGFVDDRDDDEISLHSSSSSSGSSSESITCLDEGNLSDKKKKAKEVARRGTRANPKTEVVPEPPPPEPEKPWWDGMIEEKLFEEESISGKLAVLFSILEESAALGDKVLVFSQSLFTLDLIEHFLYKRHDAGEEWELGRHYFRLDGSSSSERRAAWCKAFNMEANKTAKLFLISTRAGGLGINLVGANRVVIFDASWNPSHDLQGIFRIYRFGQVKPCFVYRLLAEATMEEKIYERQVTKLSLAHRVVDEHQIERHYTMGNLQELYRFEPLPREKWKTPIVPKDDLLAKILKNHENIIVSYHEHDSLLENKEEEELTEEERKKAWEEYNAPPAPPPPNPQLSFIMAQNAAAQLQALAQAQQYPLQSTRLPFRPGGPNLWNFPNELERRKDAVAMNQLKQISQFNTQRFANPFAARPQQNNSIRPQKSQRMPFVNTHPRLNEEFAAKLAALETMTAQELCALGQQFRFMPREGEAIHIYRQRLSQYMVSQSGSNEI